MIETRKLYAQYLSIKRNQDNKVIEEIKLLQLKIKKRKKKKSCIQQKFLKELPANENSPRLSGQPIVRSASTTEMWFN